jgi:hypothetical protein
MKARKITSGFFLVIIIAVTAAAFSGCKQIREGGLKETTKLLIRGRVNPKKLNTGLPVISIDTDNNFPVTSREKYISAKITITDPVNAGNNIDKTVKIRGRGNSTWEAIKKPYRIKFDKETPLFGMEKAKSWVLLSDYQDDTLILNTVVFELGERMGMRFTNHYTHAELVLNGVYQGNYMLTEQIQAGKGRVDIDKSKGFLVEIDGHYDDEPKFRTAILQLPVMIKHPEDISDETGYDFVKDAINTLEAALFNPSFPDSGYRDLIDLDTFVDYILINDVARNVDVQLPNSVYLYMNDGRICMGPLWDFDFGFDFGNGEYFNNTQGMFYNTVFRDSPGQVFFARFFEDPYFRAKYKARWQEIRGVLDGMTSFMDEMRSRLQKSYDANFAVYWWNRRDYTAEIQRMKNWWNTRLKYMDGEIEIFQAE